MPKRQRPYGVVAMGTARLDSRFYQVKPGLCHTGQYLHWTKNRPTTQCWWCRYQIRTREHLFEPCPGRKPSENLVGRGAEGDWEAEVPVEDPEPPGHGRCSRGLLVFQSSTDVGRWVPAGGVLREWTVGMRLRRSGSIENVKRRGRRRRRIWVPWGDWLPRRGYRCSYTPSFMASTYED